MSRLTTQEYWESYYKTENKPQKEQIINICSTYDHFFEQLINSNAVSPPKTVIEIGGYPGRYLAYLGNKYNLTPTSFDYNSDAVKIKENMEAMNVKNYHIIQDDFFTYQPQEQYDIVISNGFIEHFENFDEALDRHLLYLKKGGTLMVNIPNMRNYIRYYKLAVDKSNLEIHNLKCMHLNVFKKFGQRYKLETLKIEHYGGFPFSVHQELNFIQKIIFKLHRLIFKFFLNKWIAKYPNRYFSTSIFALYKK